MRADNTTDYDCVASLLHWLIGVALIAQIAFGFLLDTVAPRGTPARAPVINLHKSIGLVLGVLIVLRLVWRLRRGTPRWPAQMEAWQRAAARLGHRALYGCMLLMPLSGYVASNFSKHGIKFFGLALSPWGPDLPAVYAFFNRMHVFTAWLFALLIAGHVLVALKHAWLDRQPVFWRIRPLR